MANLEKNQKYCEVIESKIKLDSKPVAMKLIKTEDDLPEGYDLIDEKIRHCEMVRKASLGDKFYSTLEQQMCLGGAGAIGLRDMPPKLANGEKYFSLGRFQDLETAKNLTSKPVGGMKLAQSIVYKTGEKIEPSFAGIQSLCGDAFANPYITDGINFTLGCDGSRKAADIKDNEMAVGISAAKIEEVISGLESI